MTRSHLNSTAQGEDTRSKAALQSDGWKLRPEASDRCISFFSGRLTLNKSYNSSRSSGRIETSGMTTRSLKRKKILLVTIFSPITTDMGRTTSPTGTVFMWYSWKPQYWKIFAIFPHSLGSLVGQVCEKRNPSRAIRNKEGKSLSYRSQEDGEALHRACSLLALFPGHLPRATVRDKALGWMVLQLFLRIKPP